MKIILRQHRKKSITKFSLQITYLKFHSNLPGANELVVKIVHGDIRIF